MSGSGPYLFGNEAPEAGERFGALASLFDPTTIDHMARLGVSTGWHCLEVGAGGGSVVAWLADRVGPSGHVLATDLDIRWLEPRLQMSNVEVRRHDLVDDPLPERAFDLVHERLVLIHVPEREAVLQRLVASLRPGGWLLAQDFDSTITSDPFPAPSSDDEVLGNRIVDGVRSLLVQRGADTKLGRRLPQMLRDVGLVEVGADAFQAIDSGDSIRELLVANIAQVADQLVAGGAFASADLQRFLRLLESRTVNPVSPSLVSAWGRRL